MATLADRIVEALRDSGKPMEDGQLARTLGVQHQAVNQTCRKLESQGIIARRVISGLNIKNVLIGSPEPKQEPPRTVVAAPRAGLIKEDEVKAAVADHLKGQGYVVKVAWGRERGIDIEATRPGSRILIEAKGEVALQPQQANYFVGALGELVQRLADPDARYGLALPDNRQYRGLVSRLPALARQRLDLVVYFVARSGDGELVVEEG